MQPETVLVDTGCCQQYRQQRCYSQFYPSP
jgi:hypothetical protein